MKRAFRSWFLHAGLVGALATAFSACSKTAPSGQTLNSAPQSRASGRPAPASLLGAELRRDPSAVPEDDLIAIDDTKREAAVRALARIQDEQSFAALAKALSDEKPAVVTWAAFGVGHLCRTREPEAVRKLVLRATTVFAQPPDPARNSALRELSVAIGRCASEEAERSLRAWLRLDPELAELAALGLAQLARRRKRLDDATIAALLDAAAKQGSGTYLHPLESLPGLGSAAQQRLLEVARPVLERAEPARAFAIRALAKANADAAHPLLVLLEAASTSDGERAEAARSLSALGEAGQSALAAALRQQARSLLDTKAWLTSQHGVVLTMLEGLAPKSAEPGVLLELAQLPLGGEAPPVLRRKIMLRCRAAALLAGR
ncbi:MAG TPA: HEAT repeat domain-containing protein, partial [Polyangiaceae bacterium]|nr:HEAT repeat domain-containing protein [Polyangiaceae bacterium]